MSVRKLMNVVLVKYCGMNAQNLFKATVGFYATRKNCLAGEVLKRARTETLLVIVCELNCLATKLFCFEAVLNLFFSSPT